MIPLFSFSSWVACSKDPPTYARTSLTLLCAVWSEFCVRQSLVPACTCSQSLQLPLKCTVSNWKILICCTCHFEAVLSALLCLGLASSACKPLFRGESGHFFGLTDSGVLWAGRATANKHHWHVWEYLQWMDHMGLPRTRQHEPPRSKPLSFLGGPWEHSSRWAVHLLRGTGLRCGTPGRSQEGVVSDWRPPHSLVGDAVSGAEMAVAPCLPPLAVMHRPLCLQGGLQMAADSPLFGIRQGRVLCSMSVPGVTVQH